MNKQQLIQELFIEINQSSIPNPNILWQTTQTRKQAINTKHANHAKQKRNTKTSKNKQKQVNKSKTRKTRKYTRKHTN